jgi:ribosomal-protein-alanine N-acetyltransferase
MAFHDGFKTFPELNTERLVLRQLVPEDAEAYHQHLDTVSPLLWGLRYDTVDKTRTFLAVSQKGFQNKVAIRWAITRKEQNDLIGEIKLFEFVRGSKAEIAYWLTENQRQQGFGFEAGRCALKFALEVLGLHRVEAYTQPANVASLALLEKLRFTKEGVLRKYRKEGEQWQDFVVLGLLREEY